MKKLTVISALLMSACALNAQDITHSPEAGSSAVLRHGWGQGWRPAAKIGVSADFNLNKHFAIESGLFYTFRGYTINNGGTYSNEYSTWTEHVSQTRHFLQMPVLAKFKWSIDKNTKLFWGVGPYVGVCLKNKFDSNPYYMNNSYPDEMHQYYDGYMAGTDQFGNSNLFLYEKANSFDWGITSNIGIESNNWVFKLQYDLSLGKEGSSNDVITANYHTLSLTLGYKFHL